VVEAHTPRREPGCPALASLAPRTQHETPGSGGHGGQAGTVALAEAWARWTHTLGQVSDDESQFSERVGQTEG